MSRIHFLNVLEGDCNIIQHDSARISVIDVSNASDDDDTRQELAVRSSAARQAMFSRTQVPAGKKDYKQKLSPDNPIAYLKKWNISEIWRFIVTHPDMDHLDGVKDLFDSFSIFNTWAPPNKCEKTFSDSSNGGYNKEDWEFYLKIKDKKYTQTNTKEYLHDDVNSFYKEDYITILSPTQKLIDAADECGDYNDASYVLLYTPPKKNGGIWKILFAGDSHNASWEHILKHHRNKISNIDILIAPHHGRDSGRSYEFLDVLTPTITLFGNASAKHLAYDSYPETRITNNQAGYIIMDISENYIEFYVKNQEFANDFRNKPKRNWGNSTYNNSVNGWLMCALNA
jgi:competence protein ComEC